MLSYDRFFSLFALTSLLSVTASADADEDKRLEWADVCDYHGYSWTQYEVETDDGWWLTIMRLTAINGVELSKQNEFADRPPILAMHGASMSGVDWINSDEVETPTIPGALAERGYDVWVANSRGTPYSNWNNFMWEWTWKEHYSHTTWADMGQYDIPALVTKMLEVTEKPKVTLMGYSQGGAQMWYALAKNQDFYADKVHRFVSLCGCPYPAKEQTYEESVEMFTELYDDETYYYEDMNNWAVETEMYDQQVAVAGRLQEPISFEKWAAGEIYSTEIFMKDINRVPVSIMHTTDDDACQPETLVYAYSHITVEEKFIYFERGDHGFYASDLTTEEVDRVVETIETGYPT